MSEATEQIFALVDVNNMYVSCERSLNLKLRKVPVCVLSNNDGCAVSRSNEVKALGVKMGTPWFQIKDLARQHGIIGLSSNYALYGDMSQRIMTILAEYSPNLEIYSIDEAFISCRGLGGLWTSTTAMGQHIRANILRCTTMPVCVGAGQTKTLAKLANFMAKKAPLFEGVCDLTTMSSARMEWFFTRIPVDEIWGVGRRISAKLNAMGIDTVQRLKDASPSTIRSHFGVVMERTCYELQGVSCLALEEVPPARKEIVSSRSFGELTRSVDELSEAVTMYVARASVKLRRQHSVCSAIHVFVQTNPFRTQDPQYNNGKTIPFTDPTDDTRVLTGAAIQGLISIYREGFQYKKAGVMLLGLVPNSIKQGSLFDTEATRQTSAAIMSTLDEVNQRYGRDALRLGSAGIAQRWSMKSTNRSPRYTTSWEELPTVTAN